MQSRPCGSRGSLHMCAAKGHSGQHVHPPMQTFAASAESSPGHSWAPLKEGHRNLNTIGNGCIAVMWQLQADSHVGRHAEQQGAPPGAEGDALISAAELYTSAFDLAACCVLTSDPAPTSAKLPCQLPTCALQDFQADMVIADQAFVGGQVLADVLDIPWAAMSIITPVSLTGASSKLAAADRSAVLTSRGLGPHQRCCAGLPHAACGA